MSHQELHPDGWIAGPIGGEHTGSPDRTSSVIAIKESTEYGPLGWVAEKVGNAAVSATRTDEVQVYGPAAQDAQGNMIGGHVVPLDVIEQE